ncbi:hypothetical protein AF332_19130 [Sporosarcina globispora]|uniref:Uncharacterized protein n=1 Tax=Sporosarcina globispora TaxID=1459 RepID=A0A0M0GFS7_SPOGL|nr:hypothetical protein AF332_19130 [Sporosarcina globispora]
MKRVFPIYYSVGECAEHNGIPYGLVAPLYEQGKVLAKALKIFDDHEDVYKKSYFVEIESLVLFCLETARTGIAFFR